MEEPLRQHRHLGTQRLQQIGDENGRLLLGVLDGVRAMVLAQDMRRNVQSRSRSEYGNGNGERDVMEMGMEVK